MGLALAATPGFAEARPGERVVSLDWTATAMLTTLGVRPVGVADPDLYRVWVGEPALPAGVPDVGLRTEPDLETVARLNPDLILVSPLGRSSRPLLDSIAPTQEVSLQADDGGPSHPLARAAAMLRAVAARLGRHDQAEAVIWQAEADLGAARTILEGRRLPPLLVLQFLDARHVRVYGRGSLFDDVLARLGFDNAWTAPTNLWGFGLVGIETLASLPDATLVVVDPLPHGIDLQADPATLWGNLPAVRGGHVRRLPAIWPFGELSAATRFAMALAASLSDDTARAAP